MKKITRSSEPPQSTPKTFVDPALKNNVVLIADNVCNKIDIDVFTDPRITPERRTRNSIFFSTFKDRRVSNRRNLCSMNSSWWMRRSYLQNSCE